METSDNAIDAAVESAAENQLASQGIADIAQTTLVKSIIKLAINFGGGVATLLYEALGKLINPEEPSIEAPVDETNSPT